MLAWIVGLALQSLPGPASAPSTAEIERLQACIAEAGPGGAVETCRGQVASPCMAEPGGETRAGALACVRRELSIWRGELTKAETALAAALETGHSPSRPQAFQTAQQRWRAFMEAECAQQSLLFEGGSYEANLVADCVLRLISERAVMLQDQLGELEG